MILAAGAGSRLAPLTDTLAKPLIPLFGKTLLARAVERAAELGARKIVVNAHYHLPALARAVEAMSEIRPAPELSPEDIVLGPIGGIRHALDRFTSPWVLVMNADAYLDKTPIALRQALLNPPAPVVFLTTHKEQDAPLVLGLDDQRFISSVRSLGPGGGKEPLKAGFLGVSLWSTEVLRSVVGKLEKTPLDLTPDTVEALYANGIPIKSLPFTGQFCDTGTPERLLWLHGEILSGKMGEDPDLPERKPGQHIGPFAVVHPSAKLTGPVYLASHCRIEADVRIKGPVSVGEHTVIGKGARVENSIVFEDAKIGEGTAVQNGIIAPGVKITC